MGQLFSLPLLLGITEATSFASLDLIESELLLNIVRRLVRDSPLSVGRLVCCCKTLAQLASHDELRKGRRLMARHWLFELRNLAGQRPAALKPLVSQISRQLSFEALVPNVDEPDELDLSRWQRTARPADDDHQRGTALKRVLYANETLTSMDLSVCYLTYKDATEIAKGLKVHTSLTTLNASGNFFGRQNFDGRDGTFVPAQEGLEAIADALSASNLTTLGLSENRIGPQGIKALAPGLAHASLTSLDVSRNGLGVEGAAALASGLAANRTLRTLDVRLNKLGPAGAKAIAPGVAACGSLRRLDVRFNGVEPGDEGEAAIVAATEDRSSSFVLLVSLM